MTENEILIAFNDALAVFVIIFSLIGIVFCVVKLNANNQADKRRKLEAENRELESLMQKNQKTIEELEELNKRLREVLNKL